MSKFQLAQLNIARAIGEVNDPIMHGFTSRLDEINALAEQSAGFVWRLQDESGDATAIQAFDDPLLIVNMSVWDSLEQLKNYVYKSVHIELLQQKKQWFTRLPEASQVLWWIAENEKPSVEQAVQRLEHLRQHGASEIAFTFSHPFQAPK